MTVWRLCGASMYDSPLGMVVSCATQIKREEDEEAAALAEVVLLHLC